MPDANTPMVPAPLQPVATYNASVDPSPLAVIVHCGDPRFGRAFRQFIFEGLGFKDGQFIHTVVRGGAGGYSYPDRQPKDFNFLSKRLRSHLQRFPSVKRIVLFNHADCGFYHSLPTRVSGGRPIQELMLRDLRALPGVFAQRLGDLGLSVEPYLASFTDETQSKVAFTRVI